MPAGFTREQIAAIAALAHLELDTSEIDLFAQQLGDILKYADAVQQVDTTSVTPTASVLARPAADRANKVRPSLDHNKTLNRAPDPTLNTEFFRVPRVIG